MQLKILTRRDVGDAIRVLFRKIGEGFQLLRRHTAERNLDSHHPGRVPEGVGPFDDVRRQL
jgi:hypothetical protein